MDPLENLPPESVPPEPRRDLPREPGLPKKIECQFCHSQLTPYGDVLKMGDDAKGFRDSEEKRERLVGELATAQDRVRELERELASVKAELAAKKKGLFS